MNLQDSGPRVIECMNEQKRLIDRLLNLLQEQLDVIEVDDEVRLLKIIDEKGVLIASMQEMEQRIAELIIGYSENEIQTLAKEAGELRNDLESSLVRLTEMEGVCRRKLEEKKLQVQDKVLELKQGKSLLKGYKVIPRTRPNLSENI